jgi:hypothetical protein
MILISKVSKQKLDDKLKFTVFSKYILIRNHKIKCAILYRNSRIKSEKKNTFSGLR